MVQLREGGSGQFTKIKVLRDSIHGKVIYYRWRRELPEGQGVAVKKMPKQNVDINRESETDDYRVVYLAEPPRRHAEDPYTEIGVYCFLKAQQDQPIFLLEMLDCFIDIDPKTQTQEVWLATEFARGGELFDQVAVAPFPESKVRDVMWQLLQAIRYLHYHGIGHRDISLENILLAGEGGDVVRLMDFGQAVALWREEDCQKIMKSLFIIVKTSCVATARWAKHLKNVFGGVLWAILDAGFRWGL